MLLDYLPLIGNNFNLGAAGNREDITPCHPLPEWGAIRAAEYSFTTLNVTRSQLTITQWNDDAKNPKILDKLF